MTFNLLQSREMATDLIVSGKHLRIYDVPSAALHINLDAGTIYKRLLNHRPVIQNEVHYFVKEFEVNNFMSLCDRS